MANVIYLDKAKFPRLSATLDAMVYGVGPSPPWVNDNVYNKWESCLPVMEKLLVDAEAKYTDKEMLAWTFADTTVGGGKGIPELEIVGQFLDDVAGEW